MTPAMPLMLEGIITCPHCGAIASEPMPEDACLVFLACKTCGVVLRPKSGDCCVFCSYGSVPCPPVQAQRAGSMGEAQNECSGLKPKRGP